MRKILKKIHLILSIPAGLFISLICFTGAILVFDNEIDKVFHSDRFYIADEYLDKSPLPLDELVKKVNTQLDTNVVKSVTIFAEKDRTYIADLRKGERTTIYIQPYTGQILHKETYSQTFYYKVLSLHRWLMGKPSGTGKKIVGYSTILLLIISVSGLILWIPRNKRQAKNSFRISVRKSFRRFIYDLHSVGGMYVFIFLILLSVTGLTVSFPSFKKKMENVFTEKKVNEPKDKSSEGNNIRNGEKTSVGKVQKQDNPMQKSLELLQAKFEDYEYIDIEPAKAFVHRKSMHNERAYDMVLLNKKNGEIKKINPYSESNSSARFSGWLYSLHVGSYWGIWSKILTFIAAIIGGLLPITGYYLYIKRIIKKK